MAKQWAEQQRATQEGKQGDPSTTLSHPQGMDPRDLSWASRVGQWQQQVLANDRWTSGKSEVNKPSPRSIQAPIQEQG